MSASAEAVLVKKKYDKDSDYRVNAKSSTDAWLERQGGAAKYHRCRRKKKKQEGVAVGSTPKVGSPSTPAESSVQAPISSSYGRVPTLEPRQPAIEDRGQDSPDRITSIAETRLGTTQETAKNPDNCLVSGHREEGLKANASPSEKFANSDAVRSEKVMNSASCTRSNTVGETSDTVQYAKCANRDAMLCDFPINTGYYEIFSVSANKDSFFIEMRAITMA